MDVSDYREAVEENLDSLDRWLDTLLHEQSYATRGSIELLEGLRRVVARIRDRVPAVEAEFEAAGLDPTQSAIRLGHLLNHLHQAIFTVGETARARTPAALIDSLTDVAQRYVPGEVVLLFRPGHRGLEYTFTAFGKLVLKFLEIAETVIGEPLSDVLGLGGKKVVLLAYPASEQNNVLLHSIFIHEIGHFITEEHDVPRAAFDAFQATEGELPAEFAGQHGDVLEMQKLLRRWLWELAADAAAIRIVGPAYLFGIYRSMLVGEALDQYSREHPPAWLRLRMMLDLLAEAGYLAALAPEVSAVLTAWEARLASARQRFEAQLPSAKQIIIAGRAVDRVLFGMTEKLLPYITAEIRRVVVQDAYTAEKYSEECPVLVDQLKEFIPSNEWYDERANTWRTSTLAGILNAGWTYVIAELEGAFEKVGAKTDEERREFRRRMFALIAKSVELAQIQADVAAVHVRHIPGDPPSDPDNGRTVAEADRGAPRGAAEEPSGDQPSAGS